MAPRSATTSPPRLAARSAGSRTDDTGVRRVLRRARRCGGRATSSDRSRPIAASRCSSSSSVARRPTEGPLVDAAPRQGVSDEEYRAYVRERHPGRRVPRALRDGGRRLAGTRSAGWPRSSSPPVSGTVVPAGARPARPRQPDPGRSRTRPRPPTSSGRPQWPRPRRSTTSCCRATPTGTRSPRSTVTTPDRERAAATSAGPTRRARRTSRRVHGGTRRTSRSARSASRFASEFGWHVIQKTGERESPQARGRGDRRAARGRPGRVRRAGEAVQRGHRDRRRRRRARLGGAISARAGSRRTRCSPSTRSARSARSVDAGDAGIVIYRLLETSDSEEIEEDRLDEIRANGFERWLDEVVRNGGRDLARSAVRNLHHRRLTDERGPVARHRRAAGPRRPRSRRRRAGRGGRPPRRQSPSTRHSR